MCGLFGFTTYGNNKKNFTELLQTLASNSAERGTHASGISYNSNGKLITYKKATSGTRLKPLHLDGVQAIIGHTRHATQGNYKLNYNNHPFMGVVGGLPIAMAHNGVIYNDAELKRKYKLKNGNIQTDSYIYLQLLERQKKLDFDGIKTATELLEGYYTFTILDSKNNLYFIKGDSPLTIVHIPELKIYVYASTDEILYTSLMRCGLFEYIKQNKHINIKINDGDILKIDSNGKISKGNFKPYKIVNTFNFRKWYEYDAPEELDPFDEYAQLIIDMAGGFGYSADDIQELLDSGHTLEDIEEYLYTGELF